ncbi:MULTISPECIES: hypothetical protein [Hydrocarboniphaga]|uniref:Uncharacterized protein n=1 Tax=Hydrocarboniphaga effusa AP103 TaxID=1172194 RepID=I8TAG8_9GAMM|nr:MULTISPECIES: hypothetical protein [Hydrocarboniphaga]EIT70705.1 hypothetical protein WQQ_08420 [Hydrocarboniphaga effusa AP103]MDZ4079919.1 hypothetical protein [Hydrocarboniphaga sp.]
MTNPPIVTPDDYLSALARHWIEHEIHHRAHRGLVHPGSGGAQAHPGHERLETDASSNAVFGIVQLLENGHPALWLLLVLSVVAAVRLGMKAPSSAA